MKKLDFLPRAAIALLDKNLNFVYVNDVFSLFVGADVIAEDIGFKDLGQLIRLKVNKFEHVFSVSKFIQETEITVIDTSMDFNETICIDIRELVERSKEYPDAKYCFKVTKANKEQAFLFNKACLAETDRLTGMPNRLALEHLVKTYRANDLLFKLCFFDMNGFKKINDTFGHKVGDDVLRELATRFLSFNSHNIRSFRIGGDEFVVIVKSDQYTKKSLIDHQFGQDLEERNVLMLANRLKDPIKILAREFCLSASIGVSSSEDALDIEELMSYADSAMYACKKNKKVDVVEYNKEDQSLFQSIGDIELALKDSFTRDSFELLFQPIGDISSERTQYAEGLLRWKDQQGVVHNPDYFLPIAQKAGMMLDIDKWTILATIKELAKFQKKGVYLPLAVNLSSESLIWPGLVEYVKECLLMYKISPKLLYLEVTESLLIENIEQCRSILKDLVAIGVSVSLDDFGTGYSSFLYLMHFPVSTIKIDKAFLQKLDDINSYHILDSICKISHKLGLKVVAEGVESEEQVELLKHLNCDFIQGFLYSKALPVAQLDTFVKSKLP